MPVQTRYHLDYAQFFGCYPSTHPGAAGAVMYWRAFNLLRALRIWVEERTVYLAYTCSRSYIQALIAPNEG